MMNKKARNAPVLLAVIAAGTALNLAGSALATAVWPQLYFDSLGTVLAAALCSYIPGILVGFITNMLKGITDHVSFYYSSLNVLIAIAAAYFSRKKMFRRFPQILLPVVVFTSIGGVLGSVLTWFLGGGVAVNGVTFAEQLQSDCLADLIDKIAVVGVAAIVLLLLPQSVHDRCNFDGWRDERATERAHIGIHSLNTRIIVMISAATVLVAVVVA